MDRQEILDRLRDKLAALDEDAVRKACKDAVGDGIPVYQALMEGLAKGMELVGRKYEDGEYFLAELVVAGEIMKEAMGILQTEGTAGLKPIGKVTIGTVKGDLHDIGKNVVISMLRGAGFHVIDLGVDVPREKFVKSVQDEKPDVVALSALLTTTMPEIENTIRAIGEAGARQRLKVIVGGAPVTLDFAKRIGADAYGKTAFEGAKICKAWAAERQENHNRRKA